MLRKRDFVYDYVMIDYVNYISAYRDGCTDARSEMLSCDLLLLRKIRITNHAVSATHVMSDSTRLLSSHDRHQSRAQLPVGAPRIRYYMDHTLRLIRTILSQMSVLKTILYTYAEPRVAALNILSLHLATVETAEIL